MEYANQIQELAERSVSSCTSRCTLWVHYHVILIQGNKNYSDQSRLMLGHEPFTALE